MADDFMLKKLGGTKKEPIMQRMSDDTVQADSAADIPKLKKRTVYQPKKVVANNDAMATRRKTGKKHPGVKRFVRLGVIILLLLFVLAVAIALPARKITKEAQDVARVGTEASEAIKMQDLGLAKTKLGETRNELTELQNSYKSLVWTKYIPLIGGYYRDGEHGMKAAQEFINAGDIALTEITPYADLLGFSEGTSSFVDQPADKRIETAITTFDKVTPKLGEIAQHLGAAEKELE
ncbi:hypothetical protein HY469_03035, partial [Candidatus Roizmanbacteria bacterium]|nr:hypothetical protein [Candidatus Roizmanbacteria bacterium]